MVEGEKLDNFVISLVDRKHTRLFIFIYFILQLIYLFYDEF